MATALVEWVEIHPGIYVHRDDAATTTITQYARGWYVRHCRHQRDESATAATLTEAKQLGERLNEQP